MKTIDQYRKWSSIYIKIDLVLIAGGIILAALYQSELSGLPVFGSPLIFLSILVLIFLLDLAFARWLMHILDEIGATPSDRANKIARAVGEGQSILHILILAAIAGFATGKFFPGK